MVRSFGVFLLLVVVKMPQVLFSQEFIGDFRIAENDSKVLIQWVIREGNTCDGVRVYRSADGIFFEEIGRIEGVCGSPYSAVAYDFTDSVPLLNRKAFYRLELGNLGVSETLSILVVDFSANNYRIVPHPATAGSRIYFQNPRNQQHQLHILSALGKTEAKLLTTDAFFELNATKPRAGLHLFIIKNERGFVVASGSLLLGN
ncbi:MAG TPA: hypothetical protein PK855_00400 [Bacteroidales bacterium]|nr:hypothetical protein [Bacteroidales bacterium]